MSKLIRSPKGRLALFTLLSGRPGAIAWSLLP
jgi:hypothetical protein